MGAILSRFRDFRVFPKVISNDILWRLGAKKKKTTIEILEDLDSKIKSIEQYGQNTEQRHKKIVGTLVIYSVILYIMTAFIFYFYFFPASLYDQLFYITPLLIYPLLILFTKKMVTWYYKRKISRNQEKLTEMEKEKKKILEEVTETETYKKAKEILLKFAPDQLKMTPPPTKPAEESLRRSSTPQAIVSPLPGGGELRRRLLATPSQQNLSVNTGVAPLGMVPMRTPQRSTPMLLGSRVVNTPATANRVPLPRPILPQHKSYLDRLVDYLVGDGPSNRYALICRQCESHNGMALKEEFEYFGFRCCYCNFWNPARKQKPSAPKLEMSPSSVGTPDINEHSTISTSMEQPKPAELEVSSHSDTDSDIEVVKKPNDASEMPDCDTEQCLKEDKTEVVNDVVDAAEEVVSNTKETQQVLERDGIEQMDVDDLPERS